MLELRGISVLIWALVLADAAEKSSMYMKNSGSEDLKASATGYDYQVHSGEPFTYKTFKTDMKGTLSKLAYPPITYGNYYGKYPYLPLEEIPLSPTFVPSHYDTLVNSYGIPVSYAAYAEPFKGYDNVVESFKTGTKDTASSELGAADFSKTGGQSYGDLERASHGEKGARGYSTIEEFEKALKGAKDNEQNKGFYKASGGKNGGYFEVAGYYNKNKEAGKANQGGSFSDKNHSKKGSKTTGFHNVYLKDDYNKDHSFYDKADKRGYFRRYGDYRGNKHAQEGGFKNGRNHDSGFYGASTGAKGYTDKGKVFDEERGYKGAAGDEKYYQNGEEYAGNQGKNFGKEKGFAEGEKYTGR